MPAKLIEFLNINGDEELTTDDIAAKFSVGAMSVHSCLRAALEAGALARLRNDDGEYIYVHPSRGTAKAGGDARAPWPHPVAKSASPFTNSPKPPRRSPTPPAAVDLSAVELEDGVPIKPERAKLDWPSLFGRMKPGQSCVLPRSAGATCSKAITAYKAAGLGELKRKAINDEEFRLWRLV